MFQQHKYIINAYYYNHSNVEKIEIISPHGIIINVNYCNWNKISFTNHGILSSVKQVSICYVIMLY